MISNTGGAFKNSQSIIVSLKPDFSDAKITLTAKINAVNTDNNRRAEHLKGENSFDTASSPTLAFKSTSIKKLQ